MKRFIEAMDRFFDDIERQMGKEAQTVELQIEPEDTEEFVNMCKYAEMVWNSCYNEAVREWDQERVYSRVINEMCKAKMRLTLEAYNKEVNDGGEEE